MASRVALAEHERGDARRGESIGDMDGRSLALVVAREVKRALDAETGQELRASVATTSRKRWRFDGEQQQHKRRLMVRRLEIARGQQAQLASFLQQRQAAAQAASRQLDDDPPQCTICLGVMQTQSMCDDAQLETLSCGHVFHRHCIHRWVGYNRCCPIDRQPVD